MSLDVLYNMKREMLRRKLSPRTVKTYIFWVKKFLLANKHKMPKEFSKKDVREFLYKLEELDLSGSSLNVAHNALRFMMIDILHKSIYLKIRYAKTSVRKATYLTKKEILRILNVIDNKKHKLLVSLMYGAGLRVREVTRLKVEDFSFEENIGCFLEERELIMSEQYKKLLKLQVRKQK